MKHKILFALMVATMTLSGQNGFAAGTNDVTSDLNAVIVRINAKLQQGQRTEKDLQDEIKEFDALYASYKTAKIEDVAPILSAKVGLYLQVLDDPEKAAEVFK